MSDTTSLSAHLGARLEKKPLLLMTHLVVGYPSLDANWAMLEAMDAAGVDVVELQMPFSEPIADGPSFVKANHEAIQAGTSWQDYFDLAARASAAFGFELLFMGYYNSVYAMGAERFCARLAEAGMKGFIVPDLPPEEAAELNAAARTHGLDPVLIMTPTNTQERLAELGRHASGFVYCAARKGVTGRQTDLSEGVAAFLERCREATSVPLGLGFGIRTAEDVRGLRGMADLAIIGTAGLDAWVAGGPEGYRQFLESLVAETL
ncbi:tryptophan synthase subunit alpha [Streptomyces sp. TLI_171]|uniref:tryptophan synthase subunit alpha n=1 Tax=Streptomyces sp. TLI_171 TaxID=1938859 RepID=UPI000C1953E6|nr:tryptophan synthase subunit alpha [Streptomyces sp. TLI_171]RKE19908.1 tryptophan synthase alpha chain [Streptomyces sp. TLI_171]